MKHLQFLVIQFKGFFPDIFAFEIKKLNYNKMHVKYDP